MKDEIKKQIQFIKLIQIKKCFLFILREKYFLEIMKKIKNIILFIDYIKFNLQTFNYYIFYFEFFFFISSFRILFNLIFISILVFIFLLLFTLFLVKNF